MKVCWCSLTVIPDLNKIRARFLPDFGQKWKTVIIFKVFTLFSLNHIIGNIIEPILSKLGASASEFCKWVQVGIDVYIPHRKYQVMPHSSPWFSAVCAAAIFHKNHFFCLSQMDKSSDSTVKFRQASNRWKNLEILPKTGRKLKSREIRLMFPQNYIYCA